jgi:hypothetical protein
LKLNLEDGLCLILVTHGQVPFGVKPALNSTFLSPAATKVIPDDLAITESIEYTRIYFLSEKSDKSSVLLTTIVAQFFLPDGEKFRNPF